LKRALAIDIAIWCAFGHSRAAQRNTPIEAQIGGKLAQLGQRLINGTAKKLADEFFANFAKAL
jgi:carbon monoxide dehydrogenase subunit G